MFYPTVIQRTHSENVTLQKILIYNQDKKGQKMVALLSIYENLIGLNTDRFYKRLMNIISYKIK